MTKPQHMEALDRANVVRLKRAEIGRDIKEGKLKVSDVLEHWAVQTMFVWDLLSRQKRWGSRKDGHTSGRRVTNLLRLCGIGETRQVKDLTARQKTELSKYV